MMSVSNTSERVEHFGKSKLVKDVKLHSGKKGDIIFATICTVPAMILFAIFVIFPILNMFITSFQTWSGSIGGAKTWAGIENYAVMFKSENFWHAFKNTIFLIVFVTLVTIGLALFFASVLSKGKTKGKAFFRIVFYVPNILSIVVISAIMSAVLNPTYGVIKSLYQLFDSVYQGWLADSNKVMWCIGVGMIWQAVGYYMVMYVAGMDSIPDSLYEAASLDGASKIKQFFVITLPMTWEVIRVTLTFFIISTINMSFLFVDSMTQGGAGSHVLLTYMYQQTYGISAYGYGMAISAFIFVFSYTISIIIQQLTKQRNV